MRIAENKFIELVKKEWKELYILYYFQQYQWQYQLFHLSILGR